MQAQKKYDKKPEWIKVRPAASEGYFYLKEKTRELGLSTVCQEARCPNIGECWSQKTLTIMIMGDTCTRFCKFCNVKTGKGTGWLDDNEPAHTARLLKPLNLNYVVITSVDRDDLPDNGASHFAKTIRMTKEECPKTTLEVLIGDLQGSLENLRTIVDSKPDVISHNLETVQRLTPRVRDRRATYFQSLTQLKRVKEINPQIFTKSALMLGLGEEKQEVIATMRDMRSHGIDFLSIGQYLRPSENHLPVIRYAEPKEFDELKLIGEDMGFLMVASGPLVRSSYKAGEFFIKEYIAKHRKDGYEV
ncbi:MAG: lipoyl synthase [Candidatus Cloacimonetes bacterium]|nr:lipoyl synthase [Candidatus Cloacimonadota bacterium]